MIYHEALLKDMRAYRELNARVNTWLAERVMKLVNALTDGWRDRSVKKIKIGCSRFLFFFVRCRMDAHSCRISNKKLLFMQCRADQSTILDFNYYEDKCQHIEIKENNKSVKM
jgi:hypothetical protein